MVERINKITERVDLWMNGHKRILWFLDHSNLAVFYGVFLFLYEISVLRQSIPVVHPPLIAWAFILIIYDLTVRRLWRKIPLWKPLFIFLCSAGVTTVVNWNAGIIGNLKAWVMSAIPLVVFYPVCVLLDGEERKRAFAKSFSGAAIVAFLASLIAIVMYFMDVHETLVMGEKICTIGTRYYIKDDPTSGLLLYGLNEDTNHAATYALAFSAYSVFLLRCCKLGVFRKKSISNVANVFAIANLIVQLCYFPLANSRGGWVSLITAFFCIAFIYFIGRATKHGGKFWRVCKCVCLAAGATALLSALLVGERTLLSKTYYLQERIESPEQVSDLFDKTDTLSDGSGRLVIWKEALDLFAKKPILGEGPGNNAYYAKQYGLGQNYMQKGKAVHNSYLDLLLDYGVVGFSAIMAFWILCLVCTIKCMVHRDGHVQGISYFAIAFTVLVTAISSFFLTGVFISTTADAFVMFLGAGYLIGEERRIAQ